MLKFGRIKLDAFIMIAHPTLWTPLISLRAFRNETFSAPLIAAGCARVWMRFEFSVTFQLGFEFNSIRMVKYWNGWWCYATRTMFLWEVLFYQVIIVDLKKKALDGSFSFSLTVKLFDEIVLMNSNIFLLLGITFQLRQSLCINFVSYRVKPSSNNRITLLDKAGSMMLMSHVIHSE